MSLFLGKIHYWLFNKIQWAEKAEKEIIQWAKTNGLPVEQWVKQGVEEYGEPIGNQDLDEIIDTSNIHGWLQEKISNVELRQAMLVTNILEIDMKYKENLIEILKKQGELAAQEYTDQPKTPEEMLNAINDYVIEGMPCDRNSEVISNSKDEILWEISTCIHEPYWSQVKGDVKNFYNLRDAWISSFIKALNPEFNYKKIEDEKYSIIRS